MKTLPSVLSTWQWISTFSSIVIPCVNEWTNEWVMEMFGLCRLLFRISNRNEVIFWYLYAFCMLVCAVHHVELKLCCVCVDSASALLRWNDCDCARSPRCAIALRPTKRTKRLNIHCTARCLILCETLKVVEQCDGVILWTGIWLYTVITL